MEGTSRRVTGFRVTRPTIVGRLETWATTTGAALPLVATTAIRGEKVAGQFGSRRRRSSSSRTHVAIFLGAAVMAGEVATRAVRIGTSALVSMTLPLKRRPAKMSIADIRRETEALRRRVDKTRISAAMSRLSEEEAAAVDLGGATTLHKNATGIRTSRHRKTGDQRTQMLGQSWTRGSRKSVATKPQVIETGHSSTEPRHARWASHEVTPRVIFPATNTQVATTRPMDTRAVTRPATRPPADIRTDAVRTTADISGQLPTKNAHQSTKDAMGLSRAPACPERT